MIASMWDRLVFGWRTLERGDFVLAGVLALFVAVLGGIGRFAYSDHVERRAAAQRVVDLACLAENVYYESRGEPLAGQYAVAEVTMNRVRSRRFPNTVCEVVHEARWDARRERYVGAFSWTEIEPRRPYGFEWRRAQAVAGTVYDNNTEAPLVDGALFYHATRVSPAWAATKTRVARIGRHLFYE
jgi:spore germination cell wall hydrolase CwlJ-like protein